MACAPPEDKLIMFPLRIVARAMAQVAYEDTYLTILDVDGPGAADRLRLRMYDASEPLPGTEQSWLLASTGTNVF
jgi:hypothetical protein